VLESETENFSFYRLTGTVTPYVGHLWFLSKPPKITHVVNLWRPLDTTNTELSVVT